MHSSFQNIVIVKSNCLAFVIPCLSSNKKQSKICLTGSGDFCATFFVIVVGGCILPLALFETFG